MKSLTEQPAILSVHEGSPGQFIVRVSDASHRGLVVGVTKLLQDAKSLVVITPSDIKVFAVDGDESVPKEESSGELPQSDEPIDETTQDAEPVPVAHRRGRPPKSEQAGRDEQCQRCGGIGRMQVVLDGGAASETACPICKGEGVMRRYGARR